MHIDIDIVAHILTKEIVDKIHAKGLKVNCWTVDSKEDAEKLVEWGVDFITTNILE
jgi:glycerophosphoryl diester phosphodiesterase